MTDYSEMRQALRDVNSRVASLKGGQCPRAPCFGTLRRVRGRLVCECCTKRARGPWERRPC